MASSIHLLAENALTRGQGRSHDLVHIVVAVLRQPADEGCVTAILCQFPIACVEAFVLGARNRLERISVCLRIFECDGGALVLLSGQVLEFSYSRIGVLVWVIDRANGLEMI